MRQLFAFFLFAHFLMAVTVWVPAARAADLPPDQAAEAERIRQYLNSITTLEAGFQQINGNGGLATGRFWLHRPHRLRFEYDPPHPILIVARGSFLVHYDKDLQEETFLDQKDTPAWFLLKEEVQFGKNINVLSVERDGPYTEVTAQERGKEDQGAITLLFQHEPLRLLGWRLVDASGMPVTVSLTDQKAGGPIDPKLFNFQPKQRDKEFNR